METQVQYLIIWVQAQGLLPLKINEPGTLIDVLFVPFEEEFASLNPIRPEYVGVEVKGDWAFSECIGVDGVPLVTSPGEDCYKARVVSW